MANIGTKGFFDPRLLGIWMDSDIPSHLRRYVRRPLKAHLPEVQNALPSLSASDRFAIYFYTTTATHELKHFHDMVGTPFGFAYTFGRQVREMNLIRVIQSLRRIAVPLNSWARSPDCPKEIREFFGTYWSHELFETA